MMELDAGYKPSQSLPFRPASTVMDIRRLGSLYPYPLSFMRSLLRRIMREKWDINAVRFELDKTGCGEAIYRITTPNETFHYVVFSKHLAPDEQNDRVIATDWDITVTLCAGELDDQRLQQLRANVPLQELGRLDPDCLVLSRANKSLRNYAYVVDCLSRGEQPDIETISKVGYLFRTTAVYGSGKFGMANWEKIRDSYPDFDSPFAAEMFSCFLLREFSFARAEWVAKMRNPDTAIALEPSLKRYLGIGNATGLGMAPYLIRHPLLIANWIDVRETALARVMAHTSPTEQSLGDLHCLILKAKRHLRENMTENTAQNEINLAAAAELDKVGQWVDQSRDEIPAWDYLLDYVAAKYEVETQEIINTLLMELHPDYINELEARLNITEHYDLVPQMPLAELKQCIQIAYDWALSIDFAEQKSCATFWYRSEEKREPRLGRRDEEPGADKEMLMCIARDVSQCYDDLTAYMNSHEGEAVAHFAFHHPQHRYIIRRIQTMSQTRYGDIRANLLDEDVLPIHLLRCKLSFFGVGKFDPKSKLWVRNTMFQGAPLVSDIGQETEDNWCFPLRPKADVLGG